MLFILKALLIVAKHKLKEKSEAGWAEPRFRKPKWRSLLIVVTDEPVGSCGNPAAGGASRSCNANQEERVAARRRDACDMTGEMRITPGIERDGWSIEDRLGVLAGIADQSAGNGRDRAGGAAECGSVDDQCVDLEGSRSAG